MPLLGLFNRSNSNKGSEGKASPNTVASMVDSSMFPPVEACRLVRDKILTAAAAVYIRHGVHATTSLDDDPDLSKAQKVQKRQDQYEAQEAYKNRLAAVLGEKALSPILATCLRLDPNDMESIRSDFKLSVHDAFASISLLLCNYVLLTASTKTKDTKNNEITVGGYDARVRNVLRMASIHLLAESLEGNDEDGVLLQKLQEQRQPRPKLKVGDSEDESVDVELGDLLQVELKKVEAEQETDGDDEKKESLPAVEQEEEPPLAAEDTHSEVYGNVYRHYATRKFQALEQSVADLILTEMVQNSSKKDGKKPASSDDPNATTESRYSRKNMVRAAKIGGVGVAAGAIFAVTGGLAAPGIAAGLAALGVGGTALTLAASPVALITLFGVGGGGLSAYKMKRRTDGLSEFTIHQESNKEGRSDSSFKARAHLHTTVCISGWLNDENDFQRPWGVTPSNLTREEKLERFFSVVDPDKMKDLKEMLKPYTDKKNEESKKVELWEAFTSALKEQYGKSPETLLPLELQAVSLSKEENATLHEIFGAISQSDDKDKSSAAPTIKPISPAVPVLSEREFEGTLICKSSDKETTDSSIRVWDYQTEYGGNLYTIQWETPTLLNMCRVADALINDLKSKAAGEVLKRTVLATLMASVAVPKLLMGLAGSLDNDWSLITIRSDLAGVELAKSLLQSNEKRPVNLVGYSFGARVVYACLLELARHQVIWEKQQSEKEGGIFKRKAGKDNRNNEESIAYTREPASIVQDTIMMGAPLFISRSKLRIASHMVAGRFVNCYSKKDWILSLMFQYQNISGIMRGACGTGPVQGVSGVENYDVASLVNSWHANYCRVVPDILDIVGFDQPTPIDPQNKISSTAAEFVVIETISSTPVVNMRHK